jgi:hypothetical protein
MSVPKPPALAWRLADYRRPTDDDGAQHPAARPSCHQRAGLPVSPLRACRREGQRPACSQLTSKPVAIGPSERRLIATGQQVFGMPSSYSASFSSLAAAVKSEAHQILKFKPQAKLRRATSLGRYGAESQKNIRMVDGSALVPPESPRTRTTS